VECLEDRACPSTVTLNYTDSGWWDNTGFHVATNKNYNAGQGNITTQWRDFFVFDLSAVDRPILGAELRLFNPTSGYISPDSTETFTLFDVSTPIAALRANGSGRTDIFADLGSGASFGSQTVSAVDNGHVVSVSLNSPALANLNSSRGSFFAVGGAITTINGLAEQVIFNGSGSAADTRQLVLTLADPAGPVVTASTPAGNTFAPVSALRVTFDRPIDVSTFDTIQVVSFTRTVGATVTDLSLAITGVTPVASSGGTQFDVSFTSQTALGNYTLVLGPNIRDLSGNAMDQNFNGITGEPGLPPTGDEYAAHFTIQGPRITASTPTTGTSLPNILSSLQVTFNEPVNPATFTPGGVVLIAPGGQHIAISTVIPVAGSSNTRFTMSFAPLTTTGFYQLLVLPYVEDVSGNRMDQDGNLIGGEFPGDIYSAQFGIAGPRITFPSSQLNFSGPTSSVRVTFNEPMAVSSFTPDKIARFTDASGADVPVLAVLPVAGTGFTQFDIFFAQQTTTGFYTLVIGPDIRDVYGNAMDQDGNDIPGEPGPAPAGDQFTLRFTVPGPRIISASSLGNMVAGLDRVRVTFNEPMNPATFTSAQATLTDPAGNPVAVTSVTPVPLTNNTQFDIHFVPVGPVGSYSLMIGPDIRDLYGNPMDQNGNFIPGEVPGDRFTVTFNVTPPQVTGNTLTGSTVFATATTARFTFSTPMDIASFTLDQFQLTGPGGVSQEVTAINVVPNTNNMTFEITFALTAGPGTYRITLGTGLRDIFGNHLASPFTGQFNVISSTAGPDGSGYVASATAFTGSSIVGQPGTFTAIISGDDVSNPIDLGTNTFTFYGTTYTGNNRLYVSTNGLITFGVADTSYSNTDLTSSPSEPTIAVLWTDWVTGPTPGVVAQFADFDSFGTPHKLIIEWNQLHHYGLTGTVSFQAVLSINTGAAQGDIVLNYLNLQSGDTYAEGRNSTVGIKANGTQGSNRLVLNPGTGVTPFVGTGQAVRFSVVPVVLSVTPAGPVRPPVDHAVVTFNTPIDPDTFTSAQVTLTGPGDPITISGVTPVAGSNNMQFTVTFGAQTGLGAYTLVIGPGIMDFSGHSAPQFTDHFTLGNLVHVLYVGTFSTLNWEDPATMVFTRISISQFATQSLAGFDVLWVDASQSASGTILRNRAADISAFVSAGGGLITDDVFDTFDWVPNAADVTQTRGFCEDAVHITTAGMTHPVTSGLTDAGLSNWNCSWHAYYTLSPAGVMDVLATSTNPSQALLLAGNFGAGRLVYFGGDPTGHPPVGQSVQLLRQATLWVGSYVPLPMVTAVTPSGGVPAPVDHAVVTFNVPINPDTFTPGQVVLTGPSGPIGVTNVTPVDGSGNMQFAVTLAAQTRLGAYTLVIGPGIMDFAGHSAPPFTARFTIQSTTIGNDGFGHTATSVPAQDFELVGQSGVFTIITAGTFSVPVDLGSNTFTFYGKSYTGNNQLFVSSNGLVSFGAADTNATNTDLTTTPPEPVIAPLWASWTSGTGNPMVLGKFEDTPDGGRRLILEWNRVKHTGGTGTVTFQAILTLDTGSSPGDIRFNYANLQSGDAFAEGTGATVGIKANGNNNNTEVPDPNRLLVKFMGTSPYAATGRAVLISQGLRVTDVNSGAVNLAWTWKPFDNINGYKVERSTDGGLTFSQIGMTGATETTFPDTDVMAGHTYYYRVVAFNAGGDSPPSNADGARPTDFANPIGLANTSELTANGNAIFTAGGAQLTSSATYQAGSVFTTSRVNIVSFVTSFTFQFTPGSIPPGNGITFTIQGSSPTALGPNGGGLGYGPDHPPTNGQQGIYNSVAIKFKTVSNVAGETGNDTGLFSDGRSPSVPTVGPDVNVPLDPSMINLSNLHPFHVEITYGNVPHRLVVTITDSVTGTSSSQAYDVDIPALVGGNAAYVGFTGATGQIHTGFQVIQAWTFVSALLPGGGAAAPVPGAGNANPATAGGTVAGPLALANVLAAWPSPARDLSGPIAAAAPADQGTPNVEIIDQVFQSSAPEDSGLLFGSRKPNDAGVPGIGDNLFTDLSSE
jgi:hypothetical protein